MTIIEQIKSAGYAANDFQAAHIANGLRLAELATDDERMARVALYRQWRTGTDNEYDLPARQAYEMAIAGISVKDVMRIDDAFREYDLANHG